MSSAKKDKATPLVPMLDKAKAVELHMTVLRRIDPEVEEILATAGHVCLYRMNVEDQQWQRKNIEGSLFLYKRRTQPRFQMIVLNRISTDNYMEVVHGGLEIEVNPPYLMYTHGNDEIHGIWFYEVPDLEKVGDLLHKILQQLPKPDLSDSLPEAPTPTPTALPPAAAPTPVAASPAPAPAVANGGAASSDDGDDAFWDKRVHVANDSAGRQLVPSSLGSQVAPTPSAAPAGAGPGAAPTRGGLQSLLRQAQQRHAGLQQHTSVAAQEPSAAASLAPASNDDAAAAPPAAPAAPAPAPLLTPAFFQQQAAAAKPPAVAAPASGAAGMPTGNGPSSSSGTALHQLLSKATQQTRQLTLKPDAPAGAATEAPTTAAAPPLPLPLPRAPTPAGGYGPMPPLPAMPPPLPAQLLATQRDKVRQALGRLLQSDTFVDALVSELRAVGLLQ